MAILDSKTVLPEFIKLRWMEPYTSSGLNRKTFKTIPRGVYNGFVVKPGPGAQQIQVVHDDVSGWDSTSGYAYGAFDMASGWSVAVHASIQGYTSTVAIQAGPSRNYVFDVSGYPGMTVFPVLDVQYQQGYSTTAQVKLVQAADLEADPTLVNLAKVEVPMSGNVSQGNIIYDDAAYPRILPYANRYKPGFMSRQQSEYLDFLQAVSASPALRYETTIAFDGPQDIPLPAGYTYVVGSDDLWVFKNTGLMEKGASRDYIEVDRGDGRGEKITWVGGNLREGDRIRFRIQQYAAVATSTTQVFDEGALIEANTIRMNFRGSGVSVLPDGPRAVKVIIPGGGGGGGSTKTKLNSWGSVIPIFRAVTVLSDNTIVPFDPRVSGQKFYGVTLQAIGVSGLGDVQLAGIILEAGSQVSGSPIGSDVYVAHDGLGTLTTSVPNALSGQVVRVGFSDGESSVVGGFPVDIVFDRGRLT